MDDEIDVEELPRVSLDSEMIDAWQEMFYELWPLALSVIPILLNQWKYHNFWTATFMILALLIMGMSGLFSAVMAWHNVLITYLCLIHSSNSSYLVDSLWTSSAMVLVVLSLFTTTKVVQMFILIGAILCFFAYLKWCFFTKRSGVNAGVLVAVSQLLVLMAQLKFVREHLADSSLGGAAFEMVLNAIMPHGKSQFFVYNAMKLAKQVVMRMMWNPNPVGTYLFFFFFQYAMLVLFRSCLGAYYIFMLRYKMDVDSIWAGFYVYHSDLFGPLRCVFRIVFGYEPYNIRRAMYAAVGLLFAYSEFNYALGLFVFRIFMSVAETLFVQSEYSRITRYLEFNVDFMQSAFPQKDALPWLSLSQLSEIGKFTCKVYATTNDVIKKGTGVVLNSGGRAMLYCVRHVVDGCSLVRFLDQNISSPDFRTINDDDDPMVAMKVEVGDVPTVELITKDEVFEIKALAFINTVEGEEEDFICFVPKFSVDRGKLRASVNLRKGDSGGPCFAVLEDGTLRLCGVVSKGNPRSGGGNIISFMHHSGSPGDDSSEDEPKLNAVTKFNEIRRVRFARDGPDQAGFSMSEDLWKFIQAERDNLEAFRDWNVHPKWEDRQLSVEALFVKLCNQAHEMKTTLTQRRGDNDADKDDAQKRKKSSNKEKAARKRQLAILQSVPSRLLGIYSHDDAKNIYDSFAHGMLPDIGPSDRFRSMGGSNWLIVDGDLNSEVFNAHIDEA